MPCSLQAIASMTGSVLTVTPEHVSLTLAPLLRLRPVAVALVAAGTWNAFAHDRLAA
jgi:hypothetical protein